MVKASLPDHVRAEGVAAFEDQYTEKVAKNGIMKAQLWALSSGWDVFYRRYSSGFQLAMFVLAVLALLMAI